MSSNESTTVPRAAEDRPAPARPSPEMLDVLCEMRRAGYTLAQVSTLLSLVQPRPPMELEDALDLIDSQVAS